MEQDAPSDADLLERIRELPTGLAPLREEVLANLVMLSQIPAPTGGESDRGRYVLDRFVEAGLPDAGPDRSFPSKDNCWISRDRLEKSTIVSNADGPAGSCNSRSNQSNQGFRLKDALLEGRLSILRSIQVGAEPAALPENTQ